MKKSICFILCISMVLMMTACSKEGSETDDVAATVESSTDETTSVDDTVTEAGAIDQVPETPVLRIYLVRHGETYSNSKLLLVGSGGNAQLTEEGLKDAKALGLGLIEAGVVFDAAYSSTLGRTYQTANQILEGTDLNVIQVEELKDLSWGYAEGHSGTWVFENYPVETFDMYFSEESPVAAESMEAFIERFGTALDKIAAERNEQGGNILLVAHSSMAYYLNAIFPDAGNSLNNTSVSIIEYKGDEKELISFNDTSYLEEGTKLLEEQAAVTLTIITNPLTLFEKVQILEGSSDSDYTAAGEEAMNKIAKALETETFDLVYESGLGRSRKLAALFTDTPRQNRLFSEFFFGDYEASDLSELKNENPELGIAIQEVSNILNIVTTTGESGEVAAYRMKCGLEQVGEEVDAGGNVLICSHPYILAAFVEKYIPDAEYQGTLEQAQIIKLGYQDGNFTFISADNYSGE